MSGARMWFDEAFNGYAVATPFDKSFVDWIKFQIPRQDRRYDPVTKVWTVAEKYKDTVYNKCKQLFRDVDLTEKINMASPAVSLPNSEVGEFLKLLGEEAINKALRHAALVHHPDRGGNAATMARINELWQKVKKTL